MSGIVLGALLFVSEGSRLKWRELHNDRIKRHENPQRTNCTAADADALSKRFRKSGRKGDDDSRCALIPKLLYAIPIINIH